MNEHAVRERSGAVQGQVVMPFYLICDVSYSMSGDMAALNDGLQRLQKAIVTEPVVDDVAQICIMTFSDTAKVVMPMGQMSESHTPTLSVEGGTVYGEAFRTLAQVIGQDNANLKTQGYKVFRPCAFFLTDGEPNDHDWHQSFAAALTYDSGSGTGMKSHPVFVPFGFRDAREDVLKQLAYPREKGKWYHSKNTSVEQALKGILDIIMNTVVTAGRTAGSGQPAIVQTPPAQASGIVRGDSEYDPDWV